MSTEAINVAEIFGQNVFDDTVMQERLPKKIYKNLKHTIEEAVKVSWKPSAFSRMPSSTGMAERMVTALDTPSMAALSRTLSHTMFKLNSLLCFSFLMLFCV